MDTVTDASPVISRVARWNSRGLNAFATYERCVVCISVMLYREKTGVTEGTFVRATQSSVVCVGHRNKSPIICVVVLTTSEMGGAMWNFQSSYEIRVNEVQGLRFMGMKIQCHLRHDKGGLDAKSSSGDLRGL